MLWRSLRMGGQMLAVEFCSEYKIYKLWVVDNDIKPRHVVIKKPCVDLSLSTVKVSSHLPGLFFKSFSSHNANQNRSPFWWFDPPRSKKTQPGHLFPFSWGWNIQQRSPCLPHQPGWQVSPGRAQFLFNLIFWLHKDKCIDGDLYVSYLI